MLLRRLLVIVTTRTAGTSEYFRRTDFTDFTDFTDATD